MWRTYSVISKRDEVLAFYDEQRKQNHWSKVEQCRQMGIAYRTMCDWYSGKVMPRVVLVIIETWQEAQEHPDRQVVRVNRD